MSSSSSGIDSFDRLIGLGPWRPDPLRPDLVTPDPEETVKERRPLNQK